MAEGREQQGAMKHRGLVIGSVILLLSSACAQMAPSPTPRQTPETMPSSITPSALGPSCASAPSRCGYPDGTNTGVPAGVSLVKVPSQVSSGPGWEWSDVYGAVVTTAAGAVISGLDVAGGVQVMHPNVTVKNSRITACGGVDDGDAVGVRYRTDLGYFGSDATIVHNTINGSPSGCDHRARSGVRDVFGEAPNLTVTANDISGTGNGVTIEFSGVVSDNWIHDLGHLAGDHHSGLSTHGGAVSVVYRHNTVLLYGMPQPGGGGVSAALTIYADFGHAQNVTLQDNFVSGGAYTIFAGNSGNEYSASSPATNIKVLGNRLVCGQWDYGPVAFYTPASGNEFSGNYCDQNLSAVTPS